ncbi:MAG: FAD-binding protein, partial [Dehalococcoidales bacterium]|nr:FAD-binding protein [Dehalococcoidales bacterium]
MDWRTAPEINVDVLVIGGGIAGLRAAIAARRHDRDVLLVSESPVGLRNNSAISKATFAVTGVWKNPGDS